MRRWPKRDLQSTTTLKVFTLERLEETPRELMTLVLEVVGGFCGIFFTIMRSRYILLNGIITLHDYETSSILITFCQCAIIQILDSEFDKVKSHKQSPSCPLQYP